VAAATGTTSAAAIAPRTHKCGALPHPATLNYGAAGVRFELGRSFGAGTEAVRFPERRAIVNRRTHDESLSGVRKRSPSSRCALSWQVREQAKSAKAHADISGLRTALDRYYSDHGSYPTTGQGLEALVSSGEVARVPSDPWGNSYFYQSDGRSYALKSFGADGVEGGEGANADIQTRSD
jgi:general secretion pathway protein G